MIWRTRPKDIIRPFLFAVPFDGQYVESEVKSSVGRADVVVQLQDVVYVFEFKYDGTPEEALAQIDSKQYAIPYRADGRRVVKIGVNFDSSTRTIGGWKIAKAD